MAEMVKISSTMAVRVTTGLQNQDVTNPDAHVPDRLKVNPQWPKHMILIRQGVYEYPKEILNWPSVQALAKQNIITIGSTVEKSELNEKELNDSNTAKAANEEFKLGEVRSRRRRASSLAEIAGEE